MPRLLHFILTLLSVSLVHGYVLRELDSSERLLKSNAEWSANVTNSSPNFFPDSANGQSPKVLWIGCSDSRVPESVITSSVPGEIFVERNIANQIPPDDANSMAVLEYAVDHLYVEHVIVVGHTKCGGVTASLAAATADYDSSHTFHELPASNPLNRWLSPLTEFALQLKPLFSSKAHDDALQYLVEQNVKKQVDNIAETEVMKATWQHEREGSGKKVRVHGWIYDLSTGLLKDLEITRGPSDCD